MTMNVNLMMRLLAQVLLAALFMVISTGVIFPAYADTALRIGGDGYYYNNGKPYWEIKESGNYYLDITESSFSTNNYFAIRIFASDVVLDGRYKTLTASGPITITSDGKGDNQRGVMVNGWWQQKNVQIKNLNVENKFYGIVFEWHEYGRVENCNLTTNVRGITLWNAHHMTLDGNTASNNKEYGLELDAAETVTFPDVNNSNNWLTNNTVSSNGLGGIILHLENYENHIIGNTANGNGHFGITLSNGSHHNTLSGNATSNNPTGIHIRSSFSNTINGNTITQNRDKGLWFYDATDNTIYDNYLSNAVKNVGFDGTCTGNQWNIAKTYEPPNIVGGPYLGGNFWATPDGYGFSQTTPDSDGDGICDSAYTFSGNVDQFPLHAYTVTITAPTVTTSSVSAITCNAVSSGGNVTSSGGASVTARGVCWSTSANPTVNDWHTTDGTGTGAFQSTITGLNLGAAYHVRAYATNSAGTGYGADLPFSTQPFEGVAYVSLDDPLCGTHCPCYATIRDAIDAPYDAHTIKVAEGTYTEAFTLNESRAIIVEGGWNASFTSQTPNTTKIKSPTVQNGAMTFRNLTILP